MLRRIGTCLLFGLLSYTTVRGRELHPRLQPGNWLLVYYPSAGLTLRWCLTENLVPRDRDAFVDAILANLTVPELIHQLHLVYAPNVAVSLPGRTANQTYEDYVGNQGIGVLHEL
jgi:hypothetical protein